MSDYALRAVVKGAVIGMMVLLPTGCATGSKNHAANTTKPVLSADVKNAVASIHSDNEIVQNIKQGVVEIQRGKYVAATKHFEAGLRLNPSDGQLHFLNGLSYHLRSLSGDSSMLDMAEAGYALALRFDPSNHWAAYLLGQVYFEQKRFVDAQNQFSYGLLYAPNQPELLRGLAVASYYAKDVQTSRWAAERVLDVDASNPATFRTALFTRAATGDISGAKDSLKHYQAVLSRQDTGKREEAMQAFVLQSAENRINDWQHFYGRVPLLAQADGSPSVFGSGAKAEGDLLDLGDGEQDNYTASDMTDTDSTQGGDTGVDGQGSLDPTATVETETMQGGTPKPAAQLAPIVSTIEPSGNAPVAANTEEKPKLNLPKMTLVDVVIIRTQESRVQGKGVNILSGLRATLTGTLLGANRVMGAGATRSLTFAPSLALAGLEYNFNIFNDGVNKIEVLARPSLLATENQASKFYSGAVLHVQLSSNNSDGSMVDVPVGIHLDVTPKFYDDDTVEITVHAERGFIETNSEKVGFTAFSQTSDTSVDARAVLRFGQTLILSGLSENENNLSKDGVPGLQNMPGVQYLFSREDKLETKKSVLILITPHKARYMSGKISAQEARLWAKEREQQTVHVASLQEKENIPVTNIDAAIEHLAPGQFYREFRTGDLHLDDWHNEDTLSGAMLRTLGFLYY